MWESLDQKGEGFYHRSYMYVIKLTFVDSEYYKVFLFLTMYMCFLIGEMPLLTLYTCTCIVVVCMYMVFDLVFNF